MTTAGWFALGITVFGSLCYATASILQAVGARRSVGTVRTMAHPLYMLGLLFDIFAWIGAMIALRELAVYVVESILAGSLAITVLVARFALGCRLRKRDSVAVVVTIASLSFLALSAGPQDDVHTSDELRFALCAAAMVMVLVGWGAAKVQAPGGLIAAFAGLSLGGAALIGRSLPVPEGLSGGQTALAIVTEPLTLALLTFAATGMMLYAHALQHGDVGPVTAIHWTAEVCAPSVVAMAFLGDTVRDGWLLPAIIAGVATVGAAVVLATAPATHVTAKPEESMQPALAQSVRAALPAPEIPAWVRPLGEKVIWWGAPPIWRPPNRSHPIEPAYRAAAFPSAAAVPAHRQPAYAHPAYPQPAYSQATYPQTAYSQATYPPPAHSQAPHPQLGHSGPGYPQLGHSEPGYPQSSYSGPGYPQLGHSEPGYPQLGHSGPGYPQAGYSGPGDPQPGYPQPGYPQPGDSQPGGPRPPGRVAPTARAQAMVPPYQAQPVVPSGQARSGAAPTRAQAIVPPYRERAEEPTFQNDVRAQAMVPPYQAPPEEPTFQNDVRAQAMVPPYQAPPEEPTFQNDVRAQAMVPPYQARPEGPTLQNDVRAQAMVPPYQAPPEGLTLEMDIRARAMVPPYQARPAAPEPAGDPRWWSDPSTDGEW
ncbi:hypothetical protein ACQPZJ_06450 [Actinoplanes sp. CA-054009]